MFFISRIYLMILFILAQRNLCFICNAIETVYINVNLDYLPKNTMQMVYNKSITINCTNFKNIGGIIYLNLTESITTSICTTSEIIFQIFTYYTNITTATVTLKNNDNTKKYINTTSDKIVILYVNNDYIVYVNCSNRVLPCEYQGIDQNKILDSTYQKEIYSACGDIRDLPCLTQIELTRDFENGSFNNSAFFWNKIIISRLVWPLKPKSILNCRNNGKYDENKKKCNCSSNPDFIESGPECESLQIRLTSKQYLYVLPTSNNLLIEFSLYTPALQGDTEILTIDQFDKNVLKYTINDTFHTLRIFDTFVNLNYPMDTVNNKMWRNVLINLFIDNDHQDIIFQVNDISSKNSSQISKKIDLRLDRTPLILGPLANDKKICLRNLMVNGKIADLYLPGYKNCEPNCGNCQPNENCIFLPFLSKASVKCICQMGMIKSTNPNDCITDATRTGNIASKKNETFNDIKSSSEFERLQFKFRTFATKANLTSINFTDPKLFYVTIAISNSYLMANVSNSTKLKSGLLAYNNVSDGQWHSIIFQMTDNIMEVILDENIQYNLKIRFESKFYTGQRGSENFRINSITIGPFEESKYNESCIDVISLISFATPNLNEYPVLNSSSTSTGCDRNYCQNDTCGINENCINEWQNPTCKCISNFTKTNEKCTFIKCNPNPCKNDGSCFPTTDTSDYQCRCNKNYEGKNCDILINTAAFLWWIILIVLLIFLIILIVVIIWCCCCKKTKRKTNAPDINKIHENTICYNEQAGEADYNGPPINFDLIRQTSLTKPYKVPQYPNNELRDLKMKMDKKNDDLIIDYPLEYGYEGANSDNESISSLGSKSTNQELNINPIDSKNNNFKYLKDIYK